MKRQNGASKVAVIARRSRAGTLTSVFSVSRCPRSSPLCGHRIHWRRAKSAAMRRNRYLAETLGTLFRRRICRSFAAMAAFGVRVQWRNDKEIDCCGDGKERNQRVQERAIHDPTAVNSRAKIGKIRFSGNGSDQRRQNIAYQRCDDDTKCRADDHGDRQIDHVSAQKKLLETRKHDSASHWLSENGRKNSTRRTKKTRQMPRLVHLEAVIVPLLGRGTA